MSCGGVNDCIVWIHSVVSSFVFLCEIFALVARLMAVDQDGHDDEKQEDYQQNTC